MASDVNAIKRKIRKIRTMQTQESEKKGRRMGLMQRLDTEFDADTLDAGADLLETKIQVVEDNDTKLEELEGELDGITELAEAKKED